jgi:hypothetical protein
VSDAERRRKVEALAAGGSTQGERDAAAAASARLSGKVALYTAPSLESEVLAVLANLGYRLIPDTERRPGGRCIENDDGMHGLVEYLRAHTTMSKLPDAADWFRRLLAGRLVEEPSRHPSGHDSTERAFTRVTALNPSAAIPPRSK